MKKLTTLILVLLLAFALPACTNTAGDREKDNTATQHPAEGEKFLEQTSTKSETVSETPEPTIEATPVAESASVITQDVTTDEPSKQPVLQTKAPEASNTTLITRDKAIEIALNNAGLSRNNVYDLEAELDKERNGTYWEVDFETSQTEYSYDIDGYSGKIVRNEKERND